MGGLDKRKRKTKQKRIRFLLSKWYRDTANRHTSGYVALDLASFQNWQGQSLIDCDGGPKKGKSKENCGKKESGWTNSTSRLICCGLVVLLIVTNEEEFFLVHEK